MKRACARAAGILVLACAAASAHAAEAKGCSWVRSLIGGVVGAVTGTFVLPGVGTAAGAATGAAAVCGIDVLKDRWARGDAARPGSGAPAHPPS